MGLVMYRAHTNMHMRIHIHRHSPPPPYRIVANFEEPNGMLIENEPGPEPTEMQALLRREARYLPAPAPAAGPDHGCIDGLMLNAEGWAVEVDPKA